MTDGSNSELPMDEDLARALAECIESIQAGENHSEDHWAGKYPEYARQLKDLIAGHRQINHIMNGIPADIQALNEPTLVAACDDNVSESSSISGRIRYFGDYELIDEIARGGMGVVFRARQISLNRPVAVKMILSGAMATPTDVARFRQEAEAAASLDHPGIVPIHEIGESHGQHYFSMKYISGQSLGSLLKNRLTTKPGIPLKRDEIRQAVLCVLEIARAVHYAHQRGIIHRDLKPANILIDGEGHPHVTDFGLAKRMSHEHELTQTGDIVGTPGYMSPEQASGKSGLITTATDIHGLGAILYASLTCHPPFEGAHPLEVLQRIRMEPPPRPGSQSDNVDRELDAICTKCLATNPEDRYRSAGELADDLDRWLRGEPVSAIPPGIPLLFWRWLKQHFRAAVFVLVIGALTGWLLAEKYRMEQAARLQMASAVNRAFFDQLPRMENPLGVAQPGELPEFLSQFVFLAGLSCLLSLGWVTDYILRPGNAASAILTGLAIGATATVTAYFSGVGWSVVLEYAVRPIRSDLHMLAAAADSTQTAYKGPSLQDSYPGVSAQEFMFRMIGDLETRIPGALVLGLLGTSIVLLWPVAGQTFAAYLLRQRGDPLMLRVIYLIELFVPLTIALAGTAWLFSRQPSILAATVVTMILAGLATEFMRFLPRPLQRTGFCLTLLTLIVVCGNAMSNTYSMMKADLRQSDPDLVIPTLCLLCAAVVSLAVWQRWPLWRYVIYVMLGAAICSPRTGQEFTLASTPNELFASAGIYMVSVTTAFVLTIVACRHCARPLWQNQRADQLAAMSRELAKLGGRPEAQRIAFIGMLVAIGVCIVAVPVIRSYLRHLQMMDAMGEALQWGELSRLRSLIKAGANIRTRHHHTTVPMIAAFRNDPDLLKQALDAGADPNSCDEFGNTALHFATLSPGIEPMLLLLKAGAAVNAQDRSGETAIMGAAKVGRPEQITLLLNAGADPKILNQDGETALAIAMSRVDDFGRTGQPDSPDRKQVIQLLKSAMRNEPE